MARRAFIGVNVRTDGIRRKEGRAEITPGGRGGQGIRVVNRPLEEIRRLEIPKDEIRNKEFVPRPFDEKQEVKPQTVNGFPVDIELSSPNQDDKKGDEIISDNDLKEIKKDKDIIIKPPPPPPPGPLYEDLPDIKSGLGVLGSGGAKPQEILGLDITTKKKKKSKKITRKQIRVDDRKKKSIRGNAKNNIKSGYKRKPKDIGAESVINVINEQVDITRKTKKTYTPTPVRSVIQIVRPRPSVPVVEVRPIRTIAGQPINNPIPRAPEVSPPPPRPQAVEPKPTTTSPAASPIRTAASRPERAVSRPTRRQVGGRY